MSIRVHRVVVKQIPKMLDGAGWRLLYRELEECMNVDRPLLVLDCSNLIWMDGSAIHFLLCCLEEAMKRNGDVKLAGLGQDARAILESAQLARLFQIFHSTADAVESFRLPNVGLASNVRAVAGSADRASENAA